MPADIPFSVGQIRRDPDPRRRGRRVRIVELGVPACYDRPDPAVMVEAIDGPVGRRTRIRADRLIRWAVVDG